MKTNLPGTSIAAALLCLTPLASVAQNIPSHPSVNHGLDRLTLLDFSTTWHTTHSSRWLHMHHALA
jgi:hypothetical protein